MDEAEKELKKKYKEFEDNPVSHPGYKEEWENFWKRRYKELKAGIYFCELSTV